MSLETAIHEEAQQTRVAIRGDATLGQLSSLMQVLEVDSATWAHEHVLLDFTELETPLRPAEQKLLEQVATVRLGKKKLSVLWP